METKFTPGPWFVTGSGLSRYVEGKVRPGVLQEVAWCGATEVSEQMEANARLIAAAPELLEALRWYVENDDTNIGMEGNEFWEEGLESGKAALAKAIGEA